MGPSEKDSKQALLDAAKRVFAIHGYDGATVKQIADEAGVNVSLVSYHFQGKEKLYVSCLQGYAENKVAIAERILRGPESLDDLKTRLSLFAEEMLLDAVNNTEICQILHRDCVGSNPVLKDLFMNTFVKHFEIFVDFLETAADRGIIRKDIQHDIYATQFMGGLVHHMRIDSLRHEITGDTISDPKFRDLLVKNAVEMMINGARAQSPTASP